jgi:two-component sensor histidine kinase
MRRGSGFITWMILFMISRGFAAFAQGPSLIRYSIDDGLPSNMVYSVIQDSKGFLWFATDRGIARFNGLSFERFSTFDGLADNESFNITEDYNERLWISAYNGTLCYFKDGKFHTAENTPFLKLPFKSEPIMTTVCRDSSVFFSFVDRSKYAKIKDGKLKIIDLKKLNGQLDIDHLISFLVKDVGAYDLVYKDQIVSIDSAGKILNTRFLKANSQYHLFYNDQSQVYLFSEHNLYNAKEELLCHFATHIDIGKTPLLRIRKIGNDYFFCSQDGLFINGTTKILDGKQVSGIAMDLSGNYWITTLKYGVYKMSRDFKEVREFSNVYSGPVLYAETLPNYLFFLTYINKNLNWIATNQTETVTGVAKTGDKIHKFPNMDSARSFFSFIRGTDVITRWVLKNGQLSNFNLHDEAISVRNVYTDGGYYNIVNYNSVLRIKHDDKGALVPGSDRLLFLNKAGTKIFAYAMDNHNFLWCSTVDSIYKIKDGIIYPQPQYHYAFRQIGTMGNYLIGVNDENKMIICNNVGDRVYTDSASNMDCIWDKIYRLDSNRAIISTNNYYRLLTVKASAGKPDFTLSIIENQFIPQQAELICCDSSNCYFLKNGSVTAIGLKQLLETPPAPKVYIMSLTTVKGSYAINSPVYISYGESKNISIKFNPLSFDRAKLKYEFSISKDGSESWGPVSTNELNLFNVDYGQHTIKVRVSGLSGKPAYDTFTLIVARPFWATWWFVAICCLAVIISMILTIWLTSSRILKKRKKKFETEIKYQTSEFKALNALMNPHFIFNSLNNIQGLINDDNKESANQYLTIFSQLVRQNMHNISQELISVEKEMILVTNYLHLEQLRFKAHLNFFIDIEDGIDLHDIFIPPLLIQPIVENAVKHGILPMQSEESYVHIRLKEQDDELHIEVEDNGVGITYAQQHKRTLHESTGLANIQKRIEHLKMIHNQDISLSITDITDDQDRVTGTLAVIKISASNH